MKRTFALILCCALLVLCFAACGSSASSNTPAAPSSPSSPSTPSSPSSSSAAPADTSKSDGKVYELIFQNHDPESSAITEYLEGWVKEVEAASDGRLKITLYNGGSLGAGTESYDMVVNKTADMAWFTTAMYGGRFPITEGLALPMMPITNSRQGALALNEVWEAGYLDPDFPDVKVMSVYTNTTSVIGVVKPGGTNQDDFKGLKLRAASGYITDFVSAIGAVPMAIPSPDTYDAVSKAVVEGYVSDWNAVAALKLPEVTDHIVDYSLLISPCITVMNNDVFNGLPADLQDILIEYTGVHMSEGMAEAWGSMVEQGKALCKDEGVEIVTLPDDVIDAWSELAASVQQKWLDTVNGKGHNAQEILDAYNAAIEHFAE